MSVSDAISLIIGLILVLYVLRGGLRFVGGVLPGGKPVVILFSVFAYLLITRWLLDSTSAVVAVAIGQTSGIVTALMLLVGLINRRVTERFPVSYKLRGLLVGVGLVIITYGVWIGDVTDSFLAFAAWALFAIIVPGVLLGVIKVPKVVGAYLSARLVELDSDPKERMIVEGDPVARSLFRVAVRHLK